MNHLLSRIKFFLTHNYGLKLLALFLAVTSWYGIRKAISFEVTASDVTVDIVPPPGFAVQYQSETGVDVTLRGSQEAVRLLDPKRLSVVIRLDPVDTAGQHEIPLNPTLVHGASGIRPIRINPPRLRVELDREEEKQVPVRPRIVGRPLSGQVESTECDPAAVTLRGPVRKLQQIDQVLTAPVDVDGRIESFTRRVAIAQPSDAWVARLTPTETLVHVVITATPAERTWTDQPVLAVLPPGARTQVRIDPPRVDVTVAGKAQTLDRLTEWVPRVFVDCTDLKPDTTYELPVQVTPPDLDAMTRTDPPGVQVTLQSF